MSKENDSKSIDVIESELKSSEKEEKDDFQWNYIKEVTDNMEKKTFRVTKDLNLLTNAWKEAELGPNDNLKPYCGVIGLCIQVEEDDNTLQLRWENMDTCWIPAHACAPAGDRKPTIPGFECDWLPPPGLEQYRDDEKNENKKEEEKKEEKDEKDEDKDEKDEDEDKDDDIKEELFESVEDDYIKEQRIVQVTASISVLKKAWKGAELGPNDNLKPYLGCVGKITNIEEDDDTVQLRWENLDTVWMPIKACFAAPNKPLSIPKLEADWLTPDGIKEEEEENGGDNIEQTSAIDEYYKKQQEESEQQWQ